MQKKVMALCLRVQFFLANLLFYHMIDAVYLCARPTIRPIHASLSRLQFAVFKTVKLQQLFWKRINDVFFSNKFGACWLCGTCTLLSGDFIGQLLYSAKLTPFL